MKRADCVLPRLRDQSKLKAYPTVRKCDTVLMSFLFFLRKISFKLMQTTTLNRILSLT